MAGTTGDGAGIPLVGAGRYGRGMTRIACAVVMMMAMAGVARAQQAPVDAPATHRFELGGRAGLWMPMDDADDYADSSLGLRVHGAYWVVPMFAIGGAFEWVAVNEEADTADLNYYGFGIDGLLTTPNPARVKPFGEIEIGRYTIDSDTFDDSESDIGFRLAGGATMEMSPSVVLMGDLAYSTVDFDLGLISIDTAALILEVGVAARL